MGDDHEQGTATAAAGDGARQARVDDALGDGRDDTAGRAGCHEACHILAEGLIQQPGDGVAVEGIHQGPPVPAKRPVLTQPQRVAEAGQPAGDGLREARRPTGGRDRLPFLRPCDFGQELASTRGVNPAWAGRLTAGQRAAD